MLKNVSEPGNQLGGDRWRECWKACVQPLPCGSAADPLCPSCFGYCCKNHRLTGLFSRDDPSKGASQLRIFWTWYADGKEQWMEEIEYRRVGK